MDRPRRGHVRATSWGHGDEDPARPAAASPPPRLRRATPDGFIPLAPVGGPEVSIITVVRNGAATIGETLASVAAQTFGDLEHVVVDGGSTDETCRLVRAAAHRPRLVSEPDHGIYDGFNKGLALARGRWITFLNADDAYADERAVERVMEAARLAPGVGVLHGDLEMIDAAGRRVSTVRFAPEPGAPWSYDLEMPVAHPTAFVARWVYASFGGFDAGYVIAADYELFLRLHLAGVDMRHVPEVLVRMREGGRSEREATLGSRERMRAWFRCTGRPPWRLIMREVKVRALDRWTPRLSGALGALKRAVSTPRLSMRREVVDPGRDPS